MIGALQDTYDYEHLHPSELIFTQCISLTKSVRQSCFIVKVNEILTHQSIKSTTWRCTSRTALVRHKKHRKFFTFYTHVQVYVQCLKGKGCNYSSNQKKPFPVKHKKNPTKNKCFQRKIQTVMLLVNQGRDSRGYTTTMTSVSDFFR